MANFVYDLTCSIVLFLVYLNGRKDSYDFSQQIFNLFTESVQLFLLLDGFAWLCEIKYTPLTCAIETILMSFLFIFQGLQGFFWLLYADIYLNNKRKLSKKFFTVLIIQLIASSAFVITSLFNGCLFYITPETGYIRGKCYFFNYLFYAAYFIFGIVMDIIYLSKSNDKDVKRGSAINLFAIVIILGCFVIQFLFMGVNLVSPAMSVAILMIYLSLQKRKLEENQIKHIMNLEAKTFGNFDILYKGQSIKFKRSKSKELLAYLIDRKGSSVSMNELYVVLWEKEYVDESTKSLLRNLISDIRQSFAALGIEGFFVKDFNSCRINPNFIYCDYYAYLDGDKSIVFTGEYMNQYSWGENTVGYLERLNSN